MNTEQFIIDRYKIDTTQPAPYFITMSRWKTMPYLFAELGFKFGAEIGVERGKYADCLLRKIPGLTLYGIDPWEEGPGYREGMRQKIDAYYNETLELLKGKNCEIIRKYSVDAAKEFADESLDFVFIDGNHDLPNVIADINAWTPKVRKGGIVSGHDYENEICKHERIDVKTAVDAWVKTYGIKTWFVTSHREYRKVWFWIKQ